jgi:poly(3-hydroxybutyrate) depolymerase
MSRLTTAAILLPIIASALSIPAWSRDKSAETKSCINHCGFFRRTFVDQQGLSHRYVIFAPSRDHQGGEPPVLLFLNGVGENGYDGLKQISNNFGLQVWENREQFPFLAIAPQCRTDGSWAPHSLDTQWALQILDQVIKEFGADEDRVYLTGVSGGGGGVWNIASAFPDRFAAILPLCGTGGDTRKLSAARMPIWNVHNDGDAESLVNSNRAVRRQLIEQGSSPLVTEYDAGGHDCWNRAYRTTAMFGWLLEQCRSRNRKSALFQYHSPERLMADWQASGGGTWTLGDEETVIGRGDETQGRGLLVSVSTGAVAELHGDVWIRGDTDCRIGFIGDAPATDSLWVSVATTDLGTGGVVTDHGAWLAPLDPAAQSTLRTDAWNDVRVRLAAGRLTVRLNGWPAVDLPVNSISSAPGVNYRCALATPEKDSDIQWRFVRTRIEGLPAARDE